jgi:hypothetical protein
VKSRFSLRLESTNGIPSDRLEENSLFSIKAKNAPSFPHPSDDGKTRDLRNGVIPNKKTPLQKGAHHTKWTRTPRQNHLQTPAGKSLPANDAINRQRQRQRQRQRRRR